MDDKSLGTTIMAITIVVMMIYFIWAFGGYFGWIPHALSEWAFKLPVIAAVYLMLFIVLWIGYTMATTPPPVPLDNPLDLDFEEEDMTSDEEEETE